MQRNIDVIISQSPVSSRYFTPEMSAVFDTQTKQVRLGDVWFPVDEQWSLKTQGTLLFSVGTSRTPEELKTQYPEAEISEVEPEVFQISLPLNDIDPLNPYAARERWEAETGEDCWEVFTIRLQNGMEFTEETQEE